MRFVACAVIAVLCGSVSSCGSAGDDVYALCRNTMTTLCEEACACVPGDECNLAAEQGAVIYFDGLEDCLGWYRDMGCRAQDDFPSPAFFDGCAIALHTPTCSQEQDDGLIVPDECIYQE